MRPFLSCGGIGTKREYKDGIEVPEKYGKAQPAEQKPRD
jgi:hypothetical protein